MCGVVGTFGLPTGINVVEATFDALHMLQHRGTEGVGAIFSNGHEFISPAPFRALGLVADCRWAWPAKKTPSRVLVSAGHVRYGTSGEHSLSTVENLQPFLVEAWCGPFCIAHNGDIPGYEALRGELQAKGATFVSNSDTEVIAQLIARQDDAPDLKSAMIKALAEVQGAFSLVMATPTALVAARDPWGYRPLALARLGEGYIVASETCAFDTLHEDRHAEFLREIEPGELLWIDEHGLQSYRFAESTLHQSCVFEGIYYARPDGQMFGRAMDEFREKLGHQLVAEHGRLCDEGAVITGVPDSSSLIAENFAKVLGRQTEIIFVRHHNAERTFIQPGEKNRENGVRLKFNVIRRRVVGKTIIMIDDSLVRGTTIRRLIRMLKRNGAARIIVLIASPPICHPCRYGIDMKTYEQLLAAVLGSDIEAIRAFIEADELRYLSMEGLERVVGDHENFCFACFNGKYAF